MGSLRALSGLRLQVWVLESFGVYDGVKAVCV